MFFILSKVFWLLAAPSHLLGVLVLAAALSVFAHLRRGAIGFSIAAVILLVGAGILPLNTWLIRALEDQYPRPSWPAHVDGVLTLSGGLDTVMLHARGVPAPGGGEIRLIEAFEVARRYPDVRIVFTGGSGRIGGAPYSEAETAKYLLTRMGLDPERLTLEENSRNTYENIMFSRALVKPKLGETWLLATSAIQMPRAIGIARHLGWNVLPWPTDYLTTPKGLSVSFDIAVNLAMTDYAVHEWIGLVAYHFSGKV